MIVLIQQYFLSSLESRKKEIDYCLQRNLNCENIDKIVLLNEKEYDLTHIKDPKSKLIFPEYGKRMTFLDAFTYANNNFEPGTIIIVSNSDIFQEDQSLLLIKDNLNDNEFYCLSRWDCTDYNQDQSILFDRKDAQDSWISKTPIRTNSKMNFSVGALFGCDNVIAHLLHEEQYILKNPSKSIKIYHVHKHQYYEPKFDHKTLPGPYYHILPSYLEQSQKIDG